MISTMRALLPAVVTIAAIFAAQPVLATNTAGWLDPAFGRNGTVSLKLPPWNPPTATAARMDAAFIIRSPTGVVTVQSTINKAEAATDDGVGYRLDALTSSGRRDPAFHGGAPLSVVLFPSIGTDPIRLYGLLPRPGGFFVVGVANVDQGPGGKMFFAHPYLWNGTRVLTYGENGNARPVFTGFADPGPGSAVVLSDGRIRACANVPPGDAIDPGIVLVGWTADGQHDETVGPNGVGYLDLDGATTCSAIVADTTDRLVVAGTGRVGGRRAAIIGRFAADGTTDATFGSGGLQTLLWPNREFTAHQLVRLGTSGFVVAGQSIDSGGVPIAYTARLDATGAMDATYGFGGVYRYPGGPGGSVLRSLDVAGDGRLIAGVARLESGGSVTETLIRIIVATGRLDQTFGRNGSVVVFDEVVDITVDSSLRTYSTGSRVGSNVEVLVQRRNG